MSIISEIEKQRRESRFFRPGNIDAASRLLTPDEEFDMGVFHEIEGEHKEESNWFERMSWGKLLIANALNRVDNSK